MSIADKILRLQTAKTNIQNALINKGVNQTTATAHGFESFSSDISQSGPSYMLKDNDSVTTFYFNTSYDLTAHCAAYSSWTYDQDFQDDVIQLGIGQLYFRRLGNDTPPVYEFVWKDTANVENSVVLWSTYSGWELEQFTPGVATTITRSNIPNLFKTIMDNLMGKTNITFGPRGGNAQPGGWFPSNPNYLWTSVSINMFYGSTWDDIFPELTYDNENKAIIGQLCTAEGVPAEQQLLLVAYDFTSENTGYGLAWSETYELEPGVESQVLSPIYSTEERVTQIGIWGENWPDGMNEFPDWIFDNQAVGSVVPLIDYPLESPASKVGWDLLWSGKSISYGNFLDDDGQEELRSLIAFNNIVELTPRLVHQWCGTGSSQSWIRSYFFKDNIYLETVQFPASLESIGESAFEGCTSLVSVNCNATNTACFLSYIGDKAFYGCDLLETYDTGGHAIYFRSIGNYAFANCPNLSTIYIRQPYVSGGYPTLGTDAFDTTSLQHIYVPSASVADYKAAAGWSQYAAFISAIPS